MVARWPSQSLTAQEALTASYAKPNLLKQDSCELMEVPIGCLSEYKLG